MIKIINSANETQAILENITNPIISEEINREFIFSFTTVIDNDKSSYVNYQNKVEVEDNYFNIVYTEEQRTSNGLFINAQCEHVSYDLLTANFTAGFTATGLFSAVATTLLSGTGFSIGTVEITASETISVNESTNARYLLMQLAALYEGELEFDKYTINLLTRRGADRGVQFRYRKNLVGVSRIVDNRTKTDANLPTISYATNVAELEFEEGYINAGVSSLEHYELGDTVKVIDEDLNLEVSLRIVKESHDTEQRMQGNVEIGEFVDDLSDTLTQIQTTSVIKDAIYNGNSIGPENGFLSTRSDELTRTYSNATDGFTMQLRDSTTASYTSVFYVQYDTATGTANLYLVGNAVFTGTVEASDIIGGTIAIGSGDNIFKADGTNGIWLGDADFADASFSSTLSGAVTADNILITGGVIQVGTTNNTFRFTETDGLWLGNTTFSSAPFRVTISGSATASDLTLTGGLFNIGTGTETMQFNTTDGLFLGSTSASTAPFNVAMSGAVTMTSATITAGTIQTGESGNARIILSSGKFQGFTSSNLTTGLYFDITTIPGTGIADLFLYHNDLALVEFFDDITQYRIRGTSTATGFVLGGTATTTYTDGDWDFTGSTIYNLITDTVSGHTHTVTVGTANYTTSADGGHSHTVEST